MLNILCMLHKNWVKYRYLLFINPKCPMKSNQWNYDNILFRCTLNYKHDKIFFDIVASLKDDYCNRKIIHKRDKK